VILYNYDDAMIGKITESRTVDGYRSIIDEINLSGVEAFEMLDSVEYNPKD
jgi:hypothetical protein